jgi:Insect cuticle protein
LTFTPDKTFFFLLILPVWHFLCFRSLFTSLRFRIQVALAALLALCAAQDYEDYQPSNRQHSPAASRYVTEAPKQEQIAILKQINKHNEDGSYTYGYEGADGSFKIETKSADGEVKGKYGYTDGEGKVRVVEYGANKYGFQPSGEGITVGFALIPLLTALSAVLNTPRRLFRLPP